MDLTPWVTRSCSRRFKRSFFSGEASLERVPGRSCVYEYLRPAHRPASHGFYGMTMTSSSEILLQWTKNGSYLCNAHGFNFCEHDRRKNGAAMILLVGAEIEETIAMVVMIMMYVGQIWPLSWNCLHRTWSWWMDFQTAAAGHFLTPFLTGAICEKSSNKARYTPSNTIVLIGRLEGKIRQPACIMVACMRR